MKRLGRIEITTKIGCTINCVYCPQKLLLRRYFENDKTKKSTLLLEDFKSCVDKLPEKTRIDFSGMAEPWLNSSCTDMVCYAVQKGHPVAIYTTLVGMTKQDFDRIKNLHFEEFVLHIPDGRSNAHIRIDNEYVQLLQEVITYKKNDISLVTGYSCHGEIHPAIINAIPKDSKLITELIDRAGNIESNDVKSKKNSGEIVCVNCEDDINHNVLLPDGTLLLCCMDYGMKHILGNLLEESYETIQNSVEAQKVRAGLKDEENDILCRNCTNGRSIHELYDEFALYKDWCEHLLRNEENKVNDLRMYKQWVENLEKQHEETKREYRDWINNLQSQNMDRDKELENYKQWIKNLERQQDCLEKENLDLLHSLETIKSWKGYKLLERFNRE